MYDVSKMGNLIRTQILFPADVLADLRLMAAQRDWGLSETVRSLVIKKVKKIRLKRKTGIETLLDLARKPYKGKAPRDLSVNDEYIYGKLAPDYGSVK